MDIIEQMLARYSIISKEDVRNAMREILQEIALLGLYSSGFFEKATFYGGTCLRIFYDLPRFSEDLDFSLLQKDENFNIEKYFKHIINEFEALGIQITTKKIAKNENSEVDTAFLNIDTNQFDNIKNIQSIKIKIDIDKNPPLYFQTETKTLLMPKSFNIKTMTLSNLYASKIHAFLFRGWKERVKGRDWYDFEWYVKNNVPLNLEHLYHRMKHCGNTSSEYITQDEIKELILARIESLDIQKAIDDIKMFIKNPKELEIWDKDYFRFLVSKISYQNNDHFLDNKIAQINRALAETKKPHIPANEETKEMDKPRRPGR